MSVLRITGYDIINSASAAGIVNAKEQITY